MKHLLSLFLAFLSLATHAQVTFKLTAVPASTPANATLYKAGSLI